MFTFGYNADLEKVEFMLEESIFKEICNGTSNVLPYVVLSNNDTLLEFLDALFSSKRFTSILSGLVKIAEANKEDKK